MPTDERTAAHPQRSVPFHESKGTYLLSIHTQNTAWHQYDPGATLQLFEKLTTGETDQGRWHNKWGGAGWEPMWQSA